ncbi:MAG: GAF domain-containing protein [Microcoleus sp. PH2017_39_LGB_O_B]|uniref:sensor histidine kinase n=1 Tax=unclassified Microcoleus TaxID=2642155 RepID=UPI001DD400BC|nr:MULTISPECIES: GAF domain-containing protein [unclassified Microcoleus]MCC3446003.1 GAF domain-containing protein [Microcoleus sp. PH2017_09_SFU_O_A]MCC3627099.1 GAF domain-containing protein [Microcoleus sp. PH2017_39_LGB_O_B]MCC3639246.1 GAF domain-containing protein [Microcoleus sp. PH2017_33_LGB_O_A]TAF85415.1 MAG: GAF domain-containing protein [Oscillatoriales cyanobacterium]
MGQEQRAKDLDEQIAGLERVLQTLREEENVEVLLETALGYLQAEFDWRLIWIGLYDRQAHRLLGKGGMTPNGDLSFLKQRFSLTPGDLLEQVVIQLRPVGVPDLRSENRAGEWRKAAQTYNIQGTTLFPLRYKDRCYGVILLGTDVWGSAPNSAEKTQLAIVFGSLATALYQIEKDWQRQQVKRPDESLLALISQLRELRSLDQYLQAVVEQAHEFIEPTRTNVYWFERERRYFWRRVSNRQIAPGLGQIRPASGITVQDLGEFYQALAAQQIVWIGESHSSLKTELTGRLMQQIRARSLLAAPIVLEGELLGFLAVEAGEPRIWQDNEKQYLRGAAQLVALTAPLSEMEERIEQTQLDRDLTAGIARAIYSDADWEATLKNTAEQLCSRLKCEYFLLLLYREEQNRFEIVSQNLPRNRRQVPSPLNALDVADVGLLQESAEPLAIENWEEDGRLGAWREVLAEAGVRSLLASSTRTKQSEGENPSRKSKIENRKSIEGLLVVGHSATRTWRRSERELVRVVSQQLGLILHSWQQSSEIDKYQEFERSIKSGLALLQHSGEPQSPQQKSVASPNMFPELPLQKLDRHFAEHVSQTIACPLVAVITWNPGHEAASISAAVAANPVFALNPEALIPVQTDALIQQTLAAGGVLQQSMSQVLLATKRWLRSPGIGEIMTVALRSAPEHAPLGIVVVADAPGRQWSELSVNLLSSMASQLAWRRRYVAVQSAQESQRLDLEMLNWYKQRRFEDFYRTVAAGLKELGELSQSILQSAKEQKDALKTLRYQQVLRQIGNALGSIHLVLKQEQWRPQFGQDAVPVSAWLRRSLDRTAPLVKQSGILLEVNRETAVSLPAGKTLGVRGDSIKLDLILCELLAMACRRSGAGDKIEIRSQLLGEEWLELSVIDSGECDRQLLAGFNGGFHGDILAVTSNRLIGQNLLICQRAVRLMGGDFSLEILENNLIVARLVLPLAGS